MVTHAVPPSYALVQKPFEPDEALMLVRRAAERKHLRTQARDLEAALATAHRFENVIAESAPMRNVLELVKRAAGSDATVPITGESGVGKEVVARAVRARAANAASSPSTSGGTLFLDELGELPLAMQVKLNRALQERTVRRVGDSSERATRDYLVALMKDVGGNVTQAAERAGVERESIHRLLKNHGVRSDDFKAKP